MKKDTKGRVKLTKSVVDGANPQEGRYRIHDTEIPGFNLAVYPSGAKSYRLEYRVKETNQSKTFTIGDAKVLTPDQARKEALRIRGIVELGDDPAQKRSERREIPLFKDFVEEYFEKYALLHKKPSSVETDRLLVRHLVRELGGKKVSAITEEDVKDVHTQLTRYSPISKKPAPIAANRVTRLMRKMMNLCEEWKYRPKHSNPCDSIKENPESHRDRVLDPDKDLDPVTGEERGPGELERFLRACSESLHDNTEHPRVILLLLTIMATGARRGEIMSLKKEEVLLHKGFILKEDHKGRRMNQKKPKRIDLNSLAVLFLRYTLSKLCREECEWVFESHVRPGNPYNNLHKPMSRLLKRSGIKDFRIHDMRHTFSTLLNDSDVPVQILSDLLGHADIKTTKGYIHPLKRKGESKSEVVSKVMREFLDLPDLDNHEGQIIDFPVQQKQSS